MIYEFEYAGRTVRIKSTDQESAEKYFKARYPEISVDTPLLDPQDVVEFSDQPDTDATN